MGNMSPACGYSILPAFLSTACLRYNCDWVQLVVIMCWRGKEPATGVRYRSPTAWARLAVYCRSVMIDLGDESMIDDRFKRLRMFGKGIHP